MGLGPNSPAAVYFSGLFLLHSFQMHGTHDLLLAALTLPTASPMLAAASVQWHLVATNGLQGSTLLLASALLGAALVGGLVSWQLRGRSASSNPGTELRKEAEAQRDEASALSTELQAQAIELEQQVEEAQSLAEELEQTNEQLAERSAEAESARAAAEGGRVRLRAILDSMPDAVDVYDDQWRWTYVNPAGAAWYRANGRDPEALIGRVVWEEFPERGASRFQHEAQQAVAERRVVEFEERRQRTGEYVETRIVPTDDGAIVLTRDVTERRRGQEMQARLAAIVESSDDAIISKSLDGTILSWNAGAERLFGYTEAEAVGQPITMLIPREYQHEEPTILGRLQRGERIEHYETERVRKDGSRRRVSLSVSPVRGSDGKIMSASKIARDITEQSRGEAERQRLVGERDAERGRLLTVLEQLPVAVAIAEAPSGRLVLGNAMLERIFGPGAGRESAADYALHWVGYHGDGQRYEATEWPLARAIREGTSVRGEVIPVQRADGSRAVINVSAAPVFGAGGRIIAGVAVFDDVTERTRAEDETRLLAEAGRILAASLEYESTLAAVAQLLVPTLADWCAIDMLATDGTLQQIAVVHPDAAKLELGRELRRKYPPDPDATTGVTSVARTGHSELYPEITDEMLAAAARDADHLQLVRELGFRSVMIVPVATQTRVLGALTLVCAESGRRYTAADLALAEEVGRRAGLAIDNAQLFKAALAASEAKGDFVATMSHELRTPLTAIIGYDELLLDGLAGPVSDTQRQHLRRIRASANHLLGLIDQVLTFSRLDAAREVIRTEPIDLGSAVDEAVTIVAPLAAERRLPLRVQPVDGRVAVVTDPGKLRQILVNLLSNAVKFTEQGEVVVAAYSRGGSLHVDVRDTGVGIPAEHLEKIFDPFWQVDQKTSRKVGGTGLGLSVSRRLARLLGGDVTVASELGTGSCFSLRLPLKTYT